MFPVFTINDTPNGAMIYTKSPSKIAKGEYIRKEFVGSANYADLQLIKFRISSSFSNWLRSVSVFVFHIFFMGSPSKVRNGIIELTIDSVTAFHSNRSWTSKNRKNDGCNSLGKIFAISVHSNGIVLIASFTRKLLRHLSWFGWGLMSITKWLHRINLSVVGDKIIGEIGYRFEHIHLNKKAPSSLAFSNVCV